MTVTVTVTCDSEKLQKRTPYDHQPTAGASLFSVPKFTALDYSCESMPHDHRTLALALFCSTFLSQFSTVTIPSPFFPYPHHCVACQKRGRRARNDGCCSASALCSPRCSPLELVTLPQEIRAAQGATCTGRYVSNRYQNRSPRMARRASH